ncbi:hypothetical protein SLA2020_275020 [Shorea laevis]
MGVDLRQVVAGVLTLTMFVMLGNMIKRDHFDSVEEKLPGGASSDNFDNAELAEQGLVTLSKSSGGLWKEDGQQLKPCWDKPVLDDVEATGGFVTFSLTNGPEYHVSQIVDAVVVARYLGATLVLLTLEEANQVTRGALKIFMMLRRFGTLQLRPEIQEVVDSMVERLRTLSRKSDGQFIAVDLRIDMLEKKGCHENGYPSLLTESRWQSSLDALKDLFPKTYTKESIIPADKKAKFLDYEGSEYEKVIDFYICSQSDVFVPAISGLFYSNVAGKRIAAGRTQILVPANIPESSASASDFITHYVSKKNHLAYSCFC